MLPKTAAASARVLLAMILLVLTSHGHAKTVPTSHPGPWPIRHWHQLQPRADQLHAMHVDDLTPQEARKVDQLYRELEGRSLRGTDNCDGGAVPARERDQCRAEVGARVLPSRPVPTIMAPAR